MPSTVVGPYFSRADHLRLLLPGIPVVLKAPGFGLGDLDDAAVLRCGEIRGFHHTLVETSQRLEGLEVRGLHESEVMGTDAEDVVHHHPFVLADTFPHIRGLTTLRLCVYLFGVIVVEMVDFV